MCHSLEWYLTNVSWCISFCDIRILDIFLSSSSNDTPLFFCGVELPLCRLTQSENGTCDSYCSYLTHHKSIKSWMWNLTQWIQVRLCISQFCWYDSTKLTIQQSPWEEHHKLLFIYFLYSRESSKIISQESTSKQTLEGHNLLHFLCVLFTQEVNYTLWISKTATLLLFDHQTCWLKHVWNRWRLVVIRLKAPGSICSAGISSTSCSSSEEGETIH